MNSQKLTTVGAVLLLTGASAHADKFYADIYGGGAFQQDVAVKNGGFNGMPGDLKFDTGWRAGGNAGYHFCKFFAAELDGSYIYNRINTVGTQPFSSTTPGTAHLNEIPLLVNGIFTLPLGRFEPYAGIGVGAAITTFDSSGILGSGPGLNPSYRDTDVTFAYQAELGFNFAVAKHLDLGVAYKFVGTTEHDWHDNNINLKTDGTMTHTVLGAATWRF